MDGTDLLTIVRLALFPLGPVTESRLLGIKPMQLLGRAVQKGTATPTHRHRRKSKPSTFIFENMSVLRVVDLLVLADKLEPDLIGRSLSGGTVSTGRSRILSRL